ncbi:MAG: PTS system mannose/fructose/N-acetylgalactosamine-transporter subunit IIB [Longimicrobiales bacterium]
MSIVLFRVDERLIHGQVVVGWGTQLRPHRIVVVDDALARSAWEQELYTLGLPGEVASDFETVAQARSHLSDWRAAHSRIIVLTRDVATMRRLAQGGSLRGDQVNIGGLHHADGRRAVLPYVFLSDEEAQELAALSEDGAIISARDLPGSRRVELDQLLKNSKRS